MAMFEDMELRENNLYSNGKIIEFELDGEAILVRDKLVYIGDVDDLYHVLVEGDTLDSLASQFYGDIVTDPSKYWWVIADANNIYDPLDLDALIGSELLIPDILRVKLLIEPTA